MEFSVRIAEVALWMMDHLMNRRLSEKYGRPYRRIPLKKKPTIVRADALEVDWNDVLPSGECYRILGNPPFGGSKVTTRAQRDGLKGVFEGMTNWGSLDYVAAWFVKAGRYAGEHVRIGLVATSSITQGEQVGQLWPVLYRQNLEIIFAYESFKWTSSTNDAAAVSVVIVGLAKKSRGVRTKVLYSHAEEERMVSECHAHISPYLVGSDSPLPIVYESSSSLNGLPAMVMGSKPIDGGNYIFTEEERDEFVRSEPGAGPYIRPYLDARSFLGGKKRFILALQKAPLSILALPKIKERMDAVCEFRKKSTSKTTRDLPPELYHLNVVPNNSFLVIPNTTSENREYVPIAYLEYPIIPSNSHMVIENADDSLFGLLTSRMHMCWLRIVGGRLKHDLRYSKGMVYNTFPVPDDYSSLKEKAGLVMHARKEHGDATLKELYGTMPANLRKAHMELDKAVDRLYRKKAFKNDSERIEFLLGRYAKMTGRQTRFGDEFNTTDKAKRKPKKQGIKPDTARPIERRPHKGRTETAPEKNQEYEDIVAHGNALVSGNKVHKKSGKYKVIADDKTYTIDGDDLRCTCSVYARLGQCAHVWAVELSRR